MKQCIYLVVSFTVAAGLGVHVVSGDHSHDTKHLIVEPDSVTIVEIDANTTYTVQAKINASANSFLLYAVHTHTSPVELSTSPINRDRKRRKEPFDQDTSLHQGVIVLNVTAPVYLRNPNLKSVHVVLALTENPRTSPVPGACNKTVNASSSADFSPGLYVAWDSHTVNLNFSNSGLLDAKRMACDAQDDFQYFVYQRFLDHRNLDEDYFLTELSETMLFEDKIRQYGTLIASGFVREPDLEGVRKVLFGAYPGAASIFAVIVQHSNNETSVYVSSATYACNLDRSLPMNCEVMWLGITKLLCACALFTGLFLAFAGHRYFLLSQFIFGFTAGSLGGYILIENLARMSYTWSLIATIAIGMLFATLWLSVWVFLGIPILSVSLPTILLGLTTACCIFFIGPMNSATFISDKNYWLTVAAITLIIPVILISFAKQAYILCCVVVGTFAIIVPVDHFVGASVKYIIINLVRRATVVDFNWAVLNVPFQTTDITLTLCWVSLTLICIIFQHLREQNRAPFPPNPYRMWRWDQEEAQNAGNESSPLLDNGLNADENDRYRLGPEVIMEIRQAAREALEAARLASAQSNLGPHSASQEETRYLQAASAPSMPNLQEASISTSSSRPVVRQSDEEMSFRPRDPFRPPTPTAEAVFQKL